ncbi:DUF4251 domain-containing protein [Mucilaginibacter sp. RS28]|uniref:DUF4251 domain-containing protein n=1 Tax=Mucilaginibacter straminoryzae TaxID=2932774 RepID=A0A9X1XAM6_9SPHI|nr:DUF4251 domain-containing protein [Mucilaginibacter straminoryzae]MCJ8211264.1 DUF4251 domain-containing protein [Mucilaginibacter straminoryzae]
MRRIKYISLLFSIMMSGSLLFAQSKKEKDAAKRAEVKQMIDDHNFKFDAQYANPQGGGQRYLTSTYDVKVTKDSLIAFLPYFGRAYFDVPYNPSDGGLKFTSTNFSYEVTDRKKNGWTVTIHPHDVKYMQTLTFYISAAAYANLSMIITNRSPITFDGMVSANKSK